MLCCGYMAPHEYAMEGRFSEKSDVFSFGVLEIVSGRRNTTFYWNELALSLLRFVCPYNSMHHKSYVKA